jgi:hypothetical protein
VLLTRSHWSVTGGRVRAGVKRISILFLFFENV